MKASIVECNNAYYSKLKNELVPLGFNVIHRLESIGDLKNENSQADLIFLDIKLGSTTLKRLTNYLNKKYKRINIIILCDYDIPYTLENKDSYEVLPISNISDLRFSVEKIKIRKMKREERRNLVVRAFTLVTVLSCVLLFYLKN